MSERRERREWHLIDHPDHYDSFRVVESHGIIHVREVLPGDELDDLRSQLAELRTAVLEVTKKHGRPQGRNPGHDDEIRRDWKKLLAMLTESEPLGPSVAEQRLAALESERGKLQRCQDRSMKIMNMANDIGCYSYNEQERLMEHARTIFNLCEEMKNTALAESEGER